MIHYTDNPTNESERKERRGVWRASSDKRVRSELWLRASDSGKLGGDLAVGHAA